MKLKTLSGKAIFPIGIGTWGIGGTWQAEYEHDQTGINAIQYSISKGQNYIDSGQIYGLGHTDEIIGKAIKGSDRKNLYLANKLWETHVAKGMARPALNSMLQKLATNYLDLLYIHKPWTDWPWREAIPQIDELIDEGKLRHFGVSNFDIPQLKEAMKLSRHPVVANQIHFNVLNPDATDSLRAFCHANRIRVIAYKPLENGLVLEHKTVKAIAQIHGTTPVQVALAWIIDHQAMPIPLAISKKHIDQNIASVNLKLSVEELVRLDKQI